MKFELIIVTLLVAANVARRGGLKRLPHHLSA